MGQAVAKLSRTQFKSNTLAEMKDERVATALGTLQDVAARREQAQAARSLHEPEAAGALRAEAPRRVRRRAAARAGWSGAGAGQRPHNACPPAPPGGRSRGAAEAQTGAPEPEPAWPGLWQRLAWAISGRGPLPGPRRLTHPSASPGNDEMAPAVEAWLQGLEMVRTRFLALLATAGIYPIQAEGQPFDPRLHLAMATESAADCADGTVVAVLRKGYRQRDRVLRYAEVAVNHAAGPAIDTPRAASLATRRPAQRQDYLQQDNTSEGGEI